MWRVHGGCALTIRAVSRVAVRSDRMGEPACRPGSVTRLSVTWAALPQMLPELRFHLSWLLISSCVFSGSGGTETELAGPGPLYWAGRLMPPGDIATD